MKNIKALIEDGGGIKRVRKTQAAPAGLSRRAKARPAPTQGV